MFTAAICAATIEAWRRYRLATLPACLFRRKIAGGKRAALYTAGVPARASGGIGCCACDGGNFEICVSKSPPTQRSCLYVWHYLAVGVKQPAALHGFALQA